MGYLEKQGKNTFVPTQSAVCLLFVSCHIQLTRVLTCTAYLGEEEAIIEFLESKTLHSSYYTSTTYY